MQENFQTFSSKVYTCLAGALGLSAFAAWITSHTSLLVLSLSPAAMIIVFIIEIGLVIWLSRASQKLSPTSALVGLGVYSLLNGFTLAYLFLYYDLGSLVITFVSCAFFFILLGTIGRTHLIDLNKFSTIFFIGLIASVIVSVVNIFLGSHGTHALRSSKNQTNQRNCRRRLRSSRRPHGSASLSGFRQSFLAFTPIFWPPPRLAAELSPK